MNTEKEMYIFIDIHYIFNIHAYAERERGPARGQVKLEFQRALSFLFFSQFQLHFSKRQTACVIVCSCVF